MHLPDTTIDPATLNDRELTQATRQAANHTSTFEYYGACRREIEYRNRVQRETGRRPIPIVIDRKRDGLS